MPSAVSSDIIWTNNQIVSCSGDSPNGLGHPLVYYTLTEGQAICGYCGRIFRLKEKRKGHSDEAESK